MDVVNKSELLLDLSGLVGAWRSVRRISSIRHRFLPTNRTSFHQSGTTDALEIHEYVWSSAALQALPTANETTTSAT